MQAPSILAVGLPGWPPTAAGWDLRPLLIGLVSAAVLRLWFGVRLRPAVWLGVFAFAPAFTGIADAFGFSVIVPATLLVAATASIVRRSRSRRSTAGGV